MSESKSKPNRGRLFGWLVAGSVALLIWTGYWHWHWRRFDSHMHGVPAFFLGLLSLILGQWVVRLCIGAIRHGRRWLFGGGAFRLCGWTALFAVSMILLFYSLERWRGHRAWAQVVDLAARQGETLDLAEIVPEPVPDEQNFARAPLFAPLLTTPLSLRSEPVPFETGDTGQLARLAGWGKWPLAEPGLKEAPWLEQEATDFQPCLNFWRGWTNHVPFVSPEDQGQEGSVPNEPSPVPQMPRSKAAALLLDSLRWVDPALAELREYSDRSYCRFPLDYEQQFWARDRPLSVLHGLIRILRLRASARLTLGQSDAALQDMELALRLAGYSSQQPWGMTSELRCVVLIDALQPIWEGLNTRRWNDEHLNAIQNQLQKLHPLVECRTAIDMDAFAMAGLCESIIPTSRRGRNRRADALPNSDEDEALKWVRLVYPTGWSLQDQAAIHRLRLQLTAAFREQPPPWVLLKKQRRVNLLLDSSDPFFGVFVVPRVRETIYETRYYYLAQTAVHQAVLACALERWRLAHDEYPATLNALAPQFLGAVPLDPINGKALNYSRLRPDRFVLYSIGLNGTDDGGRPSPRDQDWLGRPEPMPNLEQADWVWTYRSDRTLQDSGLE